MSEVPLLQCVIVPVTPFQQNASIAWCTQTKKGAFVDPGGEVERLIEAARAHDVKIEKILITHGHSDHAGGAAELSERLGIPIEGPQREDQFWIDRIEESGRKYGMTGARGFVPTRWLEEGDQVTIGNQALDVIHCPGHTPGHVVFHHPAMQIAFVGDVLFQGSIGRTDFPRGDHATLIDAITRKLWPLGDVVFVPGHGPISSFAQERHSNPHVGDRALAR